MIKSSVSIQVLPKTANNTQGEVFAIVDKVIAYIASTGLRYVVGPMETTVESDSLDTLVEIVREAQKICINQGANSVSTYVKFVYSEEGVPTINEKIEKYS